MTASDDQPSEEPAAADEAAEEQAAEDQEPPALPNADTVKVSIPVLQSQLGLMMSTLDSIDRKATFLPPVLVALASILLPKDTWSPLQTGLIALGFLAGGWAVWTVLRLVMPGPVAHGPQAAQVRPGLWLPPDDFNLRVAGSFLDSIEDVSRTSALKGRNFRRATYWSVVAIVFLIAAQVAGGLGLMTDQGNAGGASPAPAAPAATAAPSPTPAPTAAPSSTPTTGPTTSNTGPTVPTLGTQEAVRGITIPTFGEQFASKGGPVPHDVEQRIIEKGG